MHACVWELGEAGGGRGRGGAGLDPWIVHCPDRSADRPACCMSACVYMEGVGGGAWCVTLTHRTHKAGDIIPVLLSPPAIIIIIIEE